MKIIISHFNAHQTAKVVALIVLCTMFLFMIPMMLFSMLVPTPPGAAPAGSFMGPILAMALIMPFFQAAMFYLLMRFGLFLYNRFYARVGGIEFDVEKTEATSPGKEQGSTPVQ